MDHHWKRSLVFAILVQILVLGGIFRPLHAFDADDYYEKNCSSCHTIGQGDGVGPDLKGVTETRPREWLTRWIRSSESLIKSGDPVAVELFNKFKNIKMPDQDISEADMAALLDYIAAGGPADPIGGKAASSATEAEVTEGRELFLGRRTLANGGPACVSCHSAGDDGPLGGGTLGIDLTQVYSKYEDQGLSRAFDKPAFRVMKPVFADRPLTDQEVFALKAFLYQVDKTGSEGGDYQKKFIFLGIGGTVLALGLTDLIWRKRRKKNAKPWSPL